MKIISIEDNFSTHYENKYQTGVARVSRLLLDLLHSKGHECISFTPKGSTAKVDWKIIESTMSPKVAGIRYDGKTYSAQAISVCNNFSPDLIISHACRTDTTIKRLVEYQIRNPTVKIIVIQHGLPIGGPEQQNHVGLFQKLISNGGHVVAVSEYCKSEWNRKYTNFQMHGLPDVDPINSSFCFQFI